MMNRVNVGEGTTIGSYVVEEKIGAGGFGEVFRARHVVLGTRVAIKVLHLRYCSTPEVVARFVAEAKAVATISHPNIVEVFDFGTVGDRYFHVMELLQGRTLRELLRERRRLPLAEALPILRRTAEALDAAHELGIAHRDLKPDNVFLRADGRVTLIDFGLAKLVGETNLTETGAQFGTPAYMSPEQCRGKASDVATDAYSFGALAFHVLTGRPLFEGDPLEIALHHLNDPAPKPSTVERSIGPAVDAGCARLLEKDPRKRPRNLVALVDSFLTGRPARRWQRAMMLLPLVIVLAVAGAWELRPHARGPAYSVRELHAPVAGIFDAMVLDGDELLYTADTGIERLNVMSGGTSAKPFSLTTGATHLVAGSHGHFVIDTAERHLELPFEDRGENAWPVLSPDGRHVAGIVDDELVVVDTSTGVRRALGAYPAASPVTFSWTRDGASLIVNLSVTPGSTPPTLITRVDTGATRVIALPLLHELANVNSVVAINGDEIAYCAENADGSSIRLRRIDDTFGFTERIVAPLDARYSGCQLFVAHGRLVIGAMTGRPRSAVIDLSHDHPEVRELDESLGDSYGEAILPTGEALTRVVKPSGYRLAPINTQARRVEAPCEQDGKLVRKGAELLTASASTTRVRFGDAHCRPLGEWRLSVADITKIRCGTLRCFALRGDARGATLWELVEGKRDARLVQRFDLGMTELTAIAVSPAGDRIAIVDERSATLLVIDEHGATLVRGTNGLLVPQSVAWGKDSDHILVSGWDATASSTEKARIVLRELALDGSSQVVWASRFVVFGPSDAADQRIVGTARRFATTFLVAEPR